MACGGRAASRICRCKLSACPVGRCRQGSSRCLHVHAAPAELQMMHAPAAPAPSPVSWRLAKPEGRVLVARQLRRPGVNSRCAALDRHGVRLAEAAQPARARQAAARGASNGEGRAYAAGAATGTVKHVQAHAQPRTVRTLAGPRHKERLSPAPPYETPVPPAPTCLPPSCSWRGSRAAAWRGRWARARATSSSLRGARCRRAGAAEQWAQLPTTCLRGPST